MRVLRLHDLLDDLGQVVARLHRPGLGRRGHHAVHHAYVEGPQDVAEVFGLLVERDFEEVGDEVCGYAAGFDYADSARGKRYKWLR